MTTSESGFSIVLKSQPKKAKKRGNIPALLVPFDQRSPARQRAAAQIASLQIRTFADSDRSPRHRASSSAGLNEESELPSSPIPQSIDLTASTPYLTVSSASIASTSALTSKTVTPQTLYLEEIHYVDPERVLCSQAAATTILQLPFSERPGPNQSKVWSDVDLKQVQFIVNDFKHRQRHEGIQFFDAAAWTRFAPYAVQLHMYYFQSYAY